MPVADSAHDNGTSAPTGNVSSTNSAIGDQHFTNIQRRKYNNLTRWWLAPAYFLYTFGYKLGFLDGRAGYAFARMKAIYFWQIRLKIRELMSANQ